MPAKVAPIGDVETDAQKQLARLLAAVQSVKKSVDRLHNETDEGIELLVGRVSMLESDVRMHAQHESLHPDNTQTKNALHRDTRPVTKNGVPGCVARVSA